MVQFTVRSFSPCMLIFDMYVIALSMVKSKSLTIITWVSINCIVQADRYTKPLTENYSLHCFKLTIFVRRSSYKITLISDSWVNLYTYQKLIYIENVEKQHLVELSCNISQETILWRLTWPLLLNILDIILTAYFYLS